MDNKFAMKFKKKKNLDCKLKYFFLARVGRERGNKSNFNLGLILYISTKSSFISSASNLDQ